MINEVQETKVQLRTCKSWRTTTSYACTALHVNKITRDLSGSWDATKYAEAFYRRAARLISVCKQITKLFVHARMFCRPIKPRKLYPHFLGSGNGMASYSQIRKEAVKGRPRSEESSCFSCPILPWGSKTRLLRRGVEIKQWTNSI